MKVKYLAWLYERTGQHEEIIDLPQHITTVADLLDYLEILHPQCASLFKQRHVIYSAINNEMRTHDAPIENSDEVSLFSAMVGG